MNRDTCKSIRIKLQATLDTLKIPDLKITIGNASFDNTSVTFKVEVAEIHNGNVMTKEAQSFLANCEFTGFKTEDLNKVVSIGNEHYKIVGAKWHTKFPILAIRVRDNRAFKFPARAMHIALGRPEEAKRLEEVL